MATITKLVTGAPMSSLAPDIEAVGGVEDEYFIEGTATGFALADGATEYPTDGRWPVVPRHEASFRTRMVVVRPRDPAAFGGTVVVQWNNVSNGESFTSAARAAQMVADGFALVGVSAQHVGVEGTVLPSLKGIDPDRYAELHHPGDDFSYDIFTQAGMLVAPDRQTESDPLAGLEVRHVLATGASQSASRLAAYVNGVQALASVYDAFLLLVFPNVPCALNLASAPVELPRIGGANQLALLPWYEHLLRDDVGLPIIVLNSEWESAECYPNHQGDTDLVRWWEVPGSGHIGLALAEEMEIAIAMGLEGSTVTFGPATRGALHALRRWLDGGPPPPHQPRVLRQGDGRMLARDEHGNALGGIRWPDLEAPLGTHVGENTSVDAFDMMGYSTSFPPEIVAALYPDHAAWCARYEAALDHLVVTGVVLPDDAAEMLARAKAQDTLFA